MASRAGGVVVAGALVAMAGVAGWAIMRSTDEPDSEPPGYTPRLPGRAELPPPAPAPVAAQLWCVDVGAISCARSQRECELARGRVRVPSAPCEVIAPWCYEYRDRSEAGRVCTPTLDGCEQMRVTLPGEALTGCLRVADEQVGATLAAPDVQLFGITPPERWCVGVAGCVASEGQCAALREQLAASAACERRPLYCTGDAPLGITNCAGDARGCERARKSSGDFGPCRLMP